jgi:hypothetical protein
MIAELAQVAHAPGRSDLIAQRYRLKCDIACLLGVPGRELGIREHERHEEIAAPEGCL